MLKTNIRIVGRKKITTKKGDTLYKYSFLSEPFENDYEGTQAGEFWSPDEYDFGDNYTAFLGYDRVGRFGVIGIAD